MTFLTTKTGKPYAPNDLSDEFRVLVRCGQTACANARSTDSARQLRDGWPRLDAARMR